MRRWKHIVPAAAGDGGMGGLMKRRRILLLPAIALFACGLFIAMANHAVATCDSRVYSEVGAVPPHEYALVLGTARVVGGKYLNRFFTTRMAAAAALYHGGKVRKLIVSGDNRREDYNEPEDMRRALIEAGVPEEAILCDYAGRRTLDSVIRARNLFGCDDYIVVSQRDHCRRAIYIADHHGIEAVGFAADEVPANYRLKRMLREPLACCKAWLDIHVLRKRPHFEK